MARRRADAAAKTEDGALTVLLIWLGEGDDAPAVTTFMGRTFPKGEPVEVDDPELIAKARANRFFEVG